MSSRVNDALLQRIRAEFLEMPGLRLTQQQAERLWQLDAPTSTVVFDLLTGSRFLRRTDDGAFVLRRAN